MIELKRKLKIYSLYVESSPLVISIVAEREAVVKGYAFMDKSAVIPKP